MMCQICNDYPATIHITEIINDNKTELHICAECGKQKGIIGKKITFSLGDLVSGIIEEKTNVKTDELQVKKCSFCKMTFEKMRKIAKLGCVHDIGVFGEWLEPFIEKIHGSSQHVGKTPKQINQEAKKDIELAKLKKELQEAVKKEDYESAARLRDKIKNFGQNK
ncbi:MAG: UvrB/UvrC motif-containing protein [Planctomycetes bacterium]|nr:UvrB/UvrC motif-containing protein [Planctomycetota bacterium]